ncbi:MAG: tetratricopeptide repeat protein [Candidatus Omnitrophica bacterium]|nr:tetratricopeptide repeat protein [Candidatus Omnitrophota bacterium]
MSSFSGFVRAADRAGNEDVYTSESQDSFQELARSYREQGLELQKMGKVDEARSFYQKAIQLDPAFVLPYNDLGVLYETVGLLDEAEDLYLKAIELEPRYPASYSNLALIYEAKLDYKKAGYYWKKRKELGLPGDPWTDIASEHLQKLQPFVPEKPYKDEDVLSLAEQINKERNILKGNNGALAKDYFKKARVFYDSGDEVTALRMAISARQLDPANKEITEFVDKVQIRLLSR